MPKIRDMETITRKYARNSLRAFLEGRKSLKWVVSVIESSSVRGQTLEELFQELRSYGDRARFRDAYHACQEQGWFLQEKGRDKRDSESEMPLEQTNTELADIERMISEGESETLEFKKSTGQLTRAAETLCAFLNANGGTVIIGVTPERKIVGQQVSDKTQQDIANILQKFEPPAPVEIKCIRLSQSDRELILLQAAPSSETRPFTFDGRPYQRVGTTTSVMPQERYQRLLLERSHSRHRWENQEAEGVSFQDIDQEEVFRVVGAAQAAGRLVEPVGKEVSRILDRFGVHRRGTILRAAVALFGKQFLPDFPQCELRMARFRGTDKTEFLDQRQLRAPAFKLLEEALLFCQRHLPLPGRIEPGRLERVDRPLIPPDALREIVVNALIHRDYTITGGAVSLAIFDDRVEIWSPGRLPIGITPDNLSREHDSIQRNPIIAEVFYRAGLIEKWGRGTNRVIAQCLEAGIAPPEFREVAGSVVVTFRVKVGLTLQVTPQVTLQVTPQIVTLLEAARQPRSRAELQRIVGLKDRTHFQKAYLEPLLAAGWLEMTIPDKPRSRLQRYRTTAAGTTALQKSSTETS